MDAVIIGSGFGGLGAALTLAQAGADVLVLETLKYPGGCAGTFLRDGARFDAGATVAAGFGPGQLFRTWADQLSLDVEAIPLSPAVEIRAPGFELVVPSDRGAFAKTLASLPDAPSGVGAFLQQQAGVADALWPLLADPELLPPLSIRSLTRHAGRSRTYLPVARTIGRTVADVLDTHGCLDFDPLRLAVDAALQITVQTSASHADAVFGLSAMDFWFQHPVHIRGGMGRLSEALVGGIRGLGGTVSFADRARSLTREGEDWVVTHRRGRTRAPVVIANLLPRAVTTLLGDSSPELEAMHAHVEQGWGAAALFLVVEDRNLPHEAFHLQVIADPAAPLTQGNHVLISVSAADEVERAGRGQRVVTASTHVAIPASPDEVAQVHQRMRAAISEHAPELRVVSERTASPRTYDRFTGRPDGWVGGPPRVRSVANYRSAFPRPIRRGLYLVGDTVFPGQSTLATAVGGHRVATLALRDLQRHPAFGT